jgi:hypothetical protein
MSLTEHEAKEFFVATILSQASREGVALSDNEQWMLRFSETDPDFDLDPGRVQEFEAETSGQAYEAKIAGLIGRAYEHDRHLNSDSVAAYREARDCLRRGDHYLTVMVDQALGAGQAAGRAGTFVRFGILVLLAPCVVLSLLIAAGLVAIVVTSQSMREALPFAGGSLLLAGMSWYLIRIMIRQVRS